MLSSSTWGICIDYSGAHGTHAAEGERCRLQSSPQDSSDGGVLYDCLTNAKSGLWATLESTFTHSEGYWGGVMTVFFTQFCIVALNYARPSLCERKL